MTTMNNDEAGNITAEQAAQDVLKEKLADAMLPGYQAEFDAEEAELVDQCCDFRFRGVIITGIEQYTLAAIGLRVTCEHVRLQVVESLDHACAWYKSSEDFARDPAIQFSGLE